MDGLLYFLRLKVELEPALPIKVATFTG